MAIGNLLSPPPRCFWGSSPYERTAEPMKRAENPIGFGQARFTESSSRAHEGFIHGSSDQPWPYPDGTVSAGMGSRLMVMSRSQTTRTRQDSSS